MNHRALKIVIACVCFALAAALLFWQFRPTRGAADAAAGPPGAQGQDGTPDGDAPLSAGSLPYEPWM